MRVRINSEQQIQRINRLISSLEDYKGLLGNKLTYRPTKKSWSIVEIIRHMSIAHKAYDVKISNAINSPTNAKKISANLKCSYIASLLINKFPPKEGKVRLKMKTMKKFEPLLDLDYVNLDEIFQENHESLEQLKLWVHKYRTESISLKRFNSAIGPMVRFNIPEACEFILCHNERHFHQMEETLKSVDSQY